MAFGVGSVFYERYTEDNGSHNEKPSFVLSLPFGAGVKWKAGDRLNLGAEWTLRKIFADDLDVVGFDNSIDGSNPLASVIPLSRIIMTGVRFWGLCYLHYFGQTR